MPETAESRETHRSFTVRVPMSTYFKMANLANRDNMFLNQKVNQLLKLGLGEHISLDDALVVLLRNMTTNEGEDLENG